MNLSHDNILRSFPKRPLNRGSYQKAVHLINNDPKFLDSCRINFEWLDCYLESHWIVSDSYANVDALALESLSKTITGAKCLVFLHGLWPTQKQALDTLDPTLHTSIGFLWGGDYTSDAIPYHRLYSQQTRRLMQSMHPKGKYLPFLIFDTINILKNKLILRKTRRNLMNYLNLLDFVVCGWGEAEFRFLPDNRTRLLPSFNPYYSCLKVNKSTTPKTSDKETLRILIGNSGTQTNNHIDVIQSVRRYNPDVPFKFTVLLSYGDQAYIDRLISCFKNDPSVDVVIDFLSVSDFNALIEEHDFLALGSRRQQGSGFIRFAISHEKPLILFKDSIAYAFFQELDVDLMSFDAAFSSSTQSPEVLRAKFEFHQELNIRHFQDLVITLISQNHE